MSKSFFTKMSVRNKSRIRFGKQWWKKIFATTDSNKLFNLGVMFLGTHRINDTCLLCIQDLLNVLLVHKFEQNKTSTWNMNWDSLEPRNHYISQRHLQEIFTTVNLCLKYKYTKYKNNHFNTPDGGSCCWCLNATHVYIGYPSAILHTSLCFCLQLRDLR